MQLPVTVLNANTKREQGRKAQLGNIAAAKAVADIIRTTLGPRSMMKMLMDPNGAGELLHMAEPFLEKNLHPTVIVKGYAAALEDAVRTVEGMSFAIDTSNREEMLKVVSSCVATKFTRTIGTLLPELALDAVQCVAQDLGVGRQEIDIKNYAKVEKIPGGAIDDCKVLKGVMFNKDVVAPGRMRRKIHNPRILLLD
ncbi:T-complex protein 1 subunit gamma, partial [Haematococcus lacustris]